MPRGSATFAMTVMLSSVALLLLVTVDQAYALKCWRCSSDASQGEFCADPFDEKAATPNQRRLSFVNCAEPPNTQFGNSKVQQSVCKKMHQLVNNKAVVTRSCTWQDVDAPEDHCQTAIQSGPSYVKTTMCRTCSTDGCNADNAFAMLEPANIVVGHSAEGETAGNGAETSMWRGAAVLSSLVAGIVLTVQ